MLPTVYSSKKKEQKVKKTEQNQEITIAASNFARLIKESNSAYS